MVSILLSRAGIMVRENAEIGAGIHHLKAAPRIPEASAHDLRSFYGQALFPA
jgi:hypothetical protein